jgi:hypothetical protein
MSNLIETLPRWYGYVKSALAGVLIPRVEHLILEYPNDGGLIPKTRPELYCTCNEERGQYAADTR